MTVALGATIALALVWVVALRPGTPPAEPPMADPVAAAPAVPSGPGAAVEQAKAAVATANAAAARTQGTDPSVPLADGVKAGDPSRPLLAQLGRGKVLVVLFKADAADDRAAARAVAEVKGKNVVTRVAAIDDVAAYEAITAGVEVLTSPTVLVIGADRQARAITGLTDAKEIGQLVSDVRR